MNTGRIAECGRTQNFSLVWLPIIYLLWRFWASSQCLFFDFLQQKLDKYFNPGRCDYFQNSGSRAALQLFTNDSCQAGESQSNYAHNSVCGSTDNKLLPFMQKTTFQEPSAKSPSRDLLSRCHSFFSFSPLLRCAAP